MKAIQLIKLLEVKAPPIPKLRPLKVYFEYDVYEDEAKDNGFQFLGPDLISDSEKYGEDEYEDIFDLAIRNYHRKPICKDRIWFYATEFEKYDGKNVKFKFPFSIETGFTREEMDYLEYLFSLPSKQAILNLRNKTRIEFPKTTKPKVEID